MSDDYAERRRAARIERLKHDTQFGHEGRHKGTGAPDCPRTLHHHHDWFCQPPQLDEWLAAGRTGSPFATSRAGAGG